MNRTRQERGLAAETIVSAKEFVTDSGIHGAKAVIGPGDIRRYDLSVSVDGAPVQAV